MTALRFTLLSEGSSDRALIPMIVWSLRQHTRRNFQAQWADLRGLPEPPRTLQKELDDFSPLRRLSAFEAFEDDLRRLLAARGW